MTGRIYYQYWKDYEPQYQKPNATGEWVDCDKHTYETMRGRTFTRSSDKPLSNRE